MKGISVEPQIINKLRNKQFDKKQLILNSLCDGCWKQNQKLEKLAEEM